MSRESLVSRIFTNLATFEEQNEFVHDLLGCRKSIMRVWLNKAATDSLRSVMPNLPQRTTMARDYVMSMLGELPLCQSSDPQTTIDHLRMYFTMKTEKSHPQNDDVLFLKRLVKLFKEKPSESVVIPVVVPSEGSEKPSDQPSEDTDSQEPTEPTEPTQPNDQMLKHLIKLLRQ